MKLLFILLGIGTGMGVRAPIAATDGPTAGPMAQLSTSETADGVALFQFFSTTTPLSARLPVLKSAERVEAAKRALYLGQDKAQRESEERSRSEAKAAAREEVTLSTLT